LNFLSFSRYPTLPRFLLFPFSWPNNDGLSTHEEKKFIHLVYSIIEVEFSSNVGQISFSFNTLSSKATPPPHLVFLAFSPCNLFTFYFLLFYLTPVVGPVVTPPPHPSTFPFPFLNLALFSPTLHTLPLCTPHEDLPHQSLVQLSLKLQKEPQKNPPPKKKEKKEKEKF
jgi:hypothetical protein